MCAKVVGGGLQEKGGGFPIYFFIFERGWLKQNSVKVDAEGATYKKRGWGGLQEGGGLQERIRYANIPYIHYCIFEQNFP